MKRKYIILLSVLAFCSIYIVFSFWIARDVPIILQTGMQNNAEYQALMTSTVYERINPIGRHMTSSSYSYNPQFHTVKKPLLIHFFGIAKVWVTQKYDSEVMGFVEPVRMTLKLKNGKWYASSVYIRP